MDKLHFKLSKNAFSDKAKIEWYIWMNIKDAYFWKNQEIQNSSIYLDAPYFSDIKTSQRIITVYCPANRYETIYVPIKIKKNSTVREVLTQIKDFYNEKLTKKQIAEYYTNDSDQWAVAAQKKRNVKRYQLLGAKGFNGDRNPFWCKGLVRFEGIFFNKKDENYYLSLGS